MVFQSYALYPNMTVAQNIAFGLEMRNVPEGRARQGDRQAWPRCCRSSHLLDRKPGQLSGGQRQRVAMGRALARDPQAVPVRRAAVQPRRQAARRDAHRDQAPAPAHRHHHRLRHPRPDRGDDAGDRIAVMKDGVVQQFGTPDEIYDSPANLFVADFIGSPAMNLIAGDGRRQRHALSRRAAARGARADLAAARRARGGPAGIQGKPGRLRHPPRGAHRPGRRRAQRPNIATGRPAWSRSWSRPAPTPSPSPISGGKGWWRGCAPTPTCSPGTVTPLAFNLTKAVFFDPATETASLTGDDQSRHRHHRLRHRRRDDRLRTCRQRRRDPDAGARRAACRRAGMRATRAPSSSSAAFPAEGDVATKPAAPPSTPATTTMSAAIRSSMARC